jgi:hypothetical protein
LLRQAIFFNERNIHFMQIENPLAYSFIMQDEVYLLNKDKAAYAAETGSATPEIPAASNISYLGKNKNNLLVIVHYPASEFIEATHLAALENILKRLGQAIDDAAILNNAKYPDETFISLTEFFKPGKLLILGKKALPPDARPLSLNKPEIVNGCNTLFSYSFDEMMDNNEYKKAFWEQMKQL